MRLCARGLRGRERRIRFGGRQRAPRDRERARGRELRQRRFEGQLRSCLNANGVRDDREVAGSSSVCSPSAGTGSSAGTGATGAAGRNGRNGGTGATGAAGTNGPNGGTGRDLSNDGNSKRLSVFSRSANEVEYCTLADGGTPFWNHLSIANGQVWIGDGQSGATSPFKRFDIIAH